MIRGLGLAASNGREFFRMVNTLALFAGFKGLIGVLLKDVVHA